MMPIAAKAFVKQIDYYLDGLFKAIENGVAD
jgi:hypothetical protein